MDSQQVREIQQRGSVTSIGAMPALLGMEPIPRPLTPMVGRERQVLALIVGGLSDQEIVDRLFISPRTAMTHVGSILAKLEVNKQTMATRVAIERNLVEPTIDAQKNG